MLHHVIAADKTRPTHNDMCHGAKGIYEVYFKLILTYDSKTWTFMKRNKSKMHAMYMEEK
jgi:hypothetical protein